MSGDGNGSALPGSELSARLTRELSHRLRPMTGRDPDEHERSATPLELLYDLVYVIAFGIAAEQLAHGIAADHVGSALGAYVFVIFCVSWAWMNFTWFASAYDNDDALFRIATFVRMVGVVLLTLGIPASFEATAHGEDPLSTLIVVGYIVMRVPSIAVWLRAAHHDPEHRAICRAYAATIAGAQVGWTVVAILPLPLGVTVAALVGLGLAELILPVLEERRLGRAPWNAIHIAERFSLLTLIVLGEVVAATVSAVGALVDEQGITAAALLIAFAAIALAAGIWWMYFNLPAVPILERRPERVFAWRYAHLPLFGAIAAVGAGLRVTAEAVDGEEVTLLCIAWSLAIPVGVVIVAKLVSWSVLMRAFDFFHVPLLIAALVPPIAAVVLAAVAGDGGSFDVDQDGQLAALIGVMVLVVLGPVVVVLGHELVGYRHTVDVVDRYLGAEDRIGLVLTEEDPSSRFS